MFNRFIVHYTASHSAV